MFWTSMQTPYFRICTSNCSNSWSLELSCSSFTDFIEPLLSQKRTEQPWDMYGFGQPYTLLYAQVSLGGWWKSTHWSSCYILGGEFHSLPVSIFVSYLLAAGSCLWISHNLLLLLHSHWQVEFASLRRSVRLDEYQRMSKANPPSSLPAKVTNASFCTQEH